MPNIDQPTPDLRPSNALIDRMTIAAGINRLCLIFQVNHNAVINGWVAAAFGYTDAGQTTIDDLLELHNELENAARRCGLLDPDPVKHYRSRAPMEIRRALQAIADRRAKAAKHRADQIRRGQLTLFPEA